MLRSRIIPSLLLSDGGLVKTRNFTDPRYVGDPLNAVKIFNEKQVDELSFTDIDATRKGHEPNYALIERIAVECRMPLSYGGGITKAEQASRIIQLGVEKIAVSAAAIARPELISEIAAAVGRQSVSVVMDVKANRFPFRGYTVMTHNGTKKTGVDPIKFAEQAQDLGAGEIVLNSIDRDGVMEGYDIELARAVRAATDIPMTVLGGAGTTAHMADLIDALGTVGAAAGSMFVFKGRLRAVLINYARPDGV